MTLKKKIFYPTILIIMIIVIVIAIIFTTRLKTGENNEQGDLTAVTSSINSKALTLSDSLSYERVKEKLDIVNNTNLSNADRFKALGEIYFFFSFAYSTSHDPEIRNFINSTFPEFANNTFPEIQENDTLRQSFLIPCADETCGQQIDPEIKIIIKKIDDSSVDTFLKNSIKQNLEVAAYKPDSDIDDKLFGFELAIKLLEEGGHPEATEAAALLKSFVKTRYNENL